MFDLNYFISSFSEIRIIIIIIKIIIVRVIVRVTVLMIVR